MYNATTLLCTMAVLFYAPICTNCAVHEILSHINRCLFITGQQFVARLSKGFPLPQWDISLVTQTVIQGCDLHLISVIFLIVHKSLHISEITCKSFHASLIVCITCAFFPAEVNLQRGPAWLASQIIKCWLQHHLSLCLWDPGNYHKHFCESPASPALADTMVEDETPPRTFLLAPWPTWLLSSGLSMAHEKEWYSIIICCHN